MIHCGPTSCQQWITINFSHAYPAYSYFLNNDPNFNSFLLLLLQIMPRRKSLERKIGNHSQTQMETVLQLIQGGMSIRQAAKEAGVFFTTLQRYRKRQKTAEPGVQLRLTPNYSVNKVFSDHQEEILKNYYKKCALLFYGLSAKDCRHVAYQMAKNNTIKMPPTWESEQLAGVDWFRCFRRRHPDLSLRKPEACSFARATAFN